MPLPKAPVFPACDTSATEVPNELVLSELLATLTAAWTGKYRLHDEYLKLSFRENVGTNQLIWSLLVGLSPDEVLAVEDARNAPVLPLTRASGTLMLAGRRRGIFEFVPDAA